MAEIKVTEVGFQCGCTFAVYRKMVMVKLCNEHYKFNKDRTVAGLLRIYLGESDQK